MSHVLQVVADTPAYRSIRSDIVMLLEASHRTTARSVNALVTVTYWEIGRRITEFEQGGQERAAYGEALFTRPAADLSGRFGRGFSERNLEQMRLFYQAWPPEYILQTLSAESSADNIRLMASGDSPDRSQLASALISRSAVSAMPMPGKCTCV